MAIENGLIPMANDIMPSGARIPVKTRTAAKGMKMMVEGTWRHSKPTINHFSLPDNFTFGMS